MKNIKILPLILITALLLAGGAVPALAASEAPQPPEIASAAAIIADMDTGRVLYELNADVQRYPASLTKVMTVLLAVEAVERGEASLTEEVTAGQEALEGMVADGSTAGIQPGETMSLADLMYCAMLGSANEACNIIAVHISGSIESFVAAMNPARRRAGLHGDALRQHPRPARPGALHHRARLRRHLPPIRISITFFGLAGTVSYTVPATNLSGERQLSNTNGLINPDSKIYPGYYYENAKAGKTGHTNDAGYCLASMAERDGVGLVCVVLGGTAAQVNGATSYTNFTDTRALYEWVFNNFSMQEVLGTTELVTGVTVRLAEDGRGDHAPRRQRHKRAAAQLRL